MADYSNLFSQSIADDMARGAQTPTPSGAAATFASEFSSAWNDYAYNQALNQQEGAQAAYVQKSLDAYKGRYGEELPNPFVTVTGAADAPGSPYLDQGLPGTALGGDRASKLAYIRQRFTDRAAPQGDSRVPDMSPLQFPNDDQILAGGVDVSRQAQSQAAEQAIAARGPSAMAGGLAGGLATGLVDPVNALAMGVAPEVSLPLKALYMAGAFGLGAGVNDLANLKYKQLVNPSFGGADIRADMIGAAEGGAAMELGGAALSKLVGLGWRRLVATKPDVAANVPLDVHDAGVVSEKAADLDANSPFSTGHTGEAAHTEAVSVIDQQILAGQKPEAPASAVSEGSVRTADLFTAQPSLSPGPGAPDAFDLAKAGKLTPDTLEGMAGNAKAADRAHEDAAFGDRADEWRKLNRQSSNAWDKGDDDKAQEYDRQIGEIEGNLTSEQKAHLDAAYQGHDPRELRDLAGDLREVEASREDRVYQVSKYIQRIPQNPKTP